MINFPSSPTLGETFTAVGITWTWDGVKWGPTSGGGDSITIGPTPPPSPIAGALWWDSVGGQLYVWYADATSSQWVVATNNSAAMQGYLPLTGGTLTGPVIFPSGSVNAMRINALPGNPRTIYGTTNASARWSINPGDNAPEFGSNGGSNFSIGRFSDSGSLIDAPLSINRATGATTLSGGLTVNGSATFAGAPFKIETPANPTNPTLPHIDAPAGGWSSLLGSKAGLDRWHLSLGDDDPETGGNAGSNFGIYNYDDTGTIIENVLLIERATGLLGIAGIRPFTVWPEPAGNAYVNLTDDAGNQLGYMGWVGGGVILTNAETAQQLFLGSDAICSISYDVAAGYGYKCKQGMSGGYGANRFNSWYNAGDGSSQWWVDATYMGNLSFVSDYRVKKDVAPLPSTWDRVKALKPISYTHKDYTPKNAPVERGKSALDPLVVASDKERWGFIAHELQATLIEDAATGTKDEDNLLQAPNPWTVIASLTKALQEAMARIEALEAARGS